MSKQQKLDYVLGVLDKFTEPLRRFNARMEEAVRPIRKVQQATRDLARESGLKRLSAGFGQVRASARGLLGEIGAVGARLGALTAAAGYLVTTQLIAPATRFETMSATLEQLEGSTAGARKSMDWIVQFAATTPYELEQVTASFVKLRAYGLDPTNGLLRTLGDTASAMGKDVDSAVEAIADAITGENERLKEFGIKASVAGSKITYEYTDKMGRQMTAVADRHSRAAIQSTLEAIWNEKYGGAMGKRSSTMEGMWSNLQDVFTQVQLKIMNAGLFEFLKDKLAVVLQTINDMAASGELDRWAEIIGGKLVRAFEAAWEIGGALVSALGSMFSVLESVAGVLGGWENLLVVLGGLLLGKVLLGVVALTGAVAQMGIAILTTPVGWIMAAIAVIAYGVYQIIKHWDVITAFFADLCGRVVAGFTAFATLIAELWGGVVQMFVSVGETIMADWSGVFDWFAEKIGWIAEGFGMVADVAGSIADSVGGAWDSLWGEDESAQQPVASGSWTQAAGQIAERRSLERSELTERRETKVRVAFDNMPQGARVVREQSGGDLDLDMGWAMATP
ncbi:MAG: tape measure protein [Desulfovibrionaceae bacterium]